jgi:uncharacterized RDD family membrane protein YckC
MTAALIGAASCGRCGSTLGTSRPLCPGCGALLVPAAAGTVVGTFNPLLAGIARPSAARRYSCLVIDVVPVVVAAVVLVAQLVSGAYEPLVWTALLTVAYLVVQLAALTRRGRSLGRLALGLRTVDDLTGNPVSARLVVSRLSASHLTRRTVLADLRRGRDPLTVALPALRGSSLAEGSKLDAALFAAPGSGSSPQTATESALIVFDTGRRQIIRGSLLIGRSPENGRTPESGVEHPLLGLADLSRTLAKTHALLEWSGTVLWVTDLHSANGSVLVSPDGEVRPLVPGIRGPAAIGWTVRCGSRSVTVHAAPGAAHRPSSTEAP